MVGKGHKKSRGELRSKDLYRVRIGRRKGIDIWVVDGMKVRREAYCDFVYGGHDRRYAFIPEREIWIDDQVGAAEIGFTITHELRERELMLKGLSYKDAHDEALKLELRMRKKGEDERLLKEKTAPARPVRIID